MPEEPMPELDETFYPDTADLIELLAAMEARHILAYDNRNSHNTHNTQHKTYDNR